MTQEPNDAELSEEARERMEELVDDTVNEVSDDVTDIEAELDLGSIDLHDSDERAKSGTLTESDMITKARSELYKKMSELGVRDLLAIYVRGMSLEEARLRVTIKSKSKDMGVKDLREKARKAGAGRSGE